MVPLHVRECAECSEELRLISMLARVVRGRTGCPAPEALLLFAEDRLPAPELANVDRHLTACIECAADVEGLVVARRSVDAPPRPVGASASRQAWTALAQVIKSMATFEMPPVAAIVVRGETPSGAFARGLAAYGRGRHAQAQRELEVAIASKETPLDAKFFLAACRRRAGDVAGAIDLLEHVVRRRPRIGEYRWHLAQALLAEGRGEEARRQLRRVASLTGRRRAGARKLLERLDAVLDE